MSVYSTSIAHRSFIWQVSAVCFILGLILAAAAVTANKVASAGTAPARTGFVYDLQKTAEKKDAEYETVLKQKNDQISKLEEKLAKGTSASSLFLKEMDETKFNAGLTEALGPGVQVVLTDSRKQFVGNADEPKLSILIHDIDIMNVVNELKASGAEAIAVNGQRIVASTYIRCVGPVIHVNGVPAAPPYVIQAIGDPITLYNGINLPGGVLTDLRRFDPDMVHVDKKNALKLPAFGGSPPMRYAHPPAPSAVSEHDTSSSDD